MDNLIRLAPKAIPVGADNHTGCLVLFQQGQWLRSPATTPCWPDLAAQDPYAVVPDQKAFTAEPYGLGIPAKNVDFVRFVNARLAGCARTGTGPTSTTGGSRPRSGHT